MDGSRNHAWHNAPIPFYFGSTPFHHVRFKRINSYKRKRRFIWWQSFYGQVGHFFTTCLCVPLSAPNACFCNSLHYRANLITQYLRRKKPVVHSTPTCDALCISKMTALAMAWWWGIIMGCNLPSFNGLNRPPTRIIPWSSRYGLNEISELDELTGFLQANFATSSWYSWSWQCLIRICSACRISFTDNRSWLRHLCLRTFNNLCNHTSPLFFLYHDE